MRRVHILTFSRSDYASVKPLALAAHADPDLSVKVIAGGSHCLKRFGRTINEIKSDGYTSLEIVDFMKEDDSSDAELTKAFSRAVEQLTKSLLDDPPDLLFILGDRWEMLAAANAAFMARIPIAHHSGGDLTQGSADNQTRYALSVLSHVHLVALAEHAERLRAIGEEPWRIHVVGEPALTALESYATAINDIYAYLDLARETPFILATFHPTTHETCPIEEQIAIFLSALENITLPIILTAPNPDAGSSSFLTAMHTFANKKENVHLFFSLGIERYYATMAKAVCMVGNSSSGIWEAPSFKLPVVNVGSRQQDRLRAANVIDVPLEVQAIKAGMNRALSNEFRESLSELSNPYVLENTIEKILRLLKESTPIEKLLAKKFIDPMRSTDD